jgi:hypothetical protein
VYSKEVKSMRGGRHTTPFLFFSKDFIDYSRSSIILLTPTKENKTMWGTKETNERLLAEQPDHKQGFEMKKVKDLEAKYRKAAREMYHDPGHIEVDEGAEVSISDDADAGGCYVQAWVWVSAEEVVEV